MEVTFTKLERRYRMTVVRDHGPELAPRCGPGYDDHLPHDAVHLLVEAEAGLAGGAFGRIAAGWNNIFWPADPAVRRQQNRREARRRLTPAQRGDMGRSEQLASLCASLWQFRQGLRRDLPEWFSRVPPEALGSPLVGRILERLDGF